MEVRLISAQRGVRVDLAAMRRLARRTLRVLRIRQRGLIDVTLVDARRMRAVNRRCLGHDWATDVLSFRYDDRRLAGEVLVAPAVARAYATRHGVAIQQEVGRYVVHGLLHWAGFRDDTPRRRAHMRRLEDQLLRTNRGLARDAKPGLPSSPRATRAGAPATMAANRYGHSHR